MATYGGQFTLTLTDENNELIMVFNGDRNVPADSLKPQPLILPDRR
ncbi:hypothetical protein EC3006_3577 [Escherichia coli 3006]|nr:hypothetical protein EC3006_3577 [Escherichia coli 3006]